MTVASIIEPSELAELTRLDAARSWVAIAVDWGVIALAFTLVAIAPRPEVLIPMIFVIARQQHALGVLIHEAVHYRLFNSRRLNDLVVRWLLAGPLLISYDGYRRTHLDHHRFTMTPRDPDLHFVDMFPVTKRKFVASLLPDFVGLTYLGVLLHYGRIGLAACGTPGRFLVTLLPGVIVNLSAFVLLASSGLGDIYLLCWAVPMFCVLPLFLHLRGIFEHGGHVANANPMRCTSTVLNASQTFVLAPHHINYHAEHHGFPAVPHFNLPRLHGLLAERNALPEGSMHHSYGTILRRLIVSS